jgi:hypothetical protein
MALATINSVATTKTASGLLLLVALAWLPPYVADRAQNRAVTAGNTRKPTASRLPSA